MRSSQTSQPQIAAVDQVNVDKLIDKHIRKLAGTNSHHIIEGTFKSVARTLRDAVAIDSRFADAIPSTKGVLQ